MTNPSHPILPYQAPSPNTPNFGMRAAKVSWLAPLAALLLFAIGVAISFVKTGLDPNVGIAYLVIILWIVGLVSGVVALATMRRYGRIGILRPAIIGICLDVVLLLLMLGFFLYALIEAGAAAAR